MLLGVNLCLAIRDMWPSAGPDVSAESDQQAG
jgi:hypothetical protein